jgi:hypothetical protein
MSDFFQKLVSFMANAAALGAGAGFLVYLWKNDLLRWEMAAILALMVVLFVTEIFAVSLTTSVIQRERDFGFGMAVIGPVGVFGYLYAPVGLYLIHTLSKPLNIRWPLYTALTVFVLYIVASLLSTVRR